MPVKVENGIYMVDFWVKPQKVSEISAADAAGTAAEPAPFQGQQQA